MLTTQLYFDEAVTSDIYKGQPYDSHTGRDTFNDSDGIFDKAVLLDLSRDDDGVLGAISFDLEKV